MNAEGLPRKLAILRDNLERLEQIPQGSLAVFVSDFRNLDSALHRLQTSIQALIDIASYLTAKHALGPPESSVDALQKLEDAKLIPPGSTVRFTPVLGFRNRVVHLYDRIDPAIVFRILTEERHDLAELAKLLTAALTISDSET
jgi:uncharacterized protein YutE (UPF0331/DUF86 family)